MRRSEGGRGWVPNYGQSVGSPNLSADAADSRLTESGRNNQALIDGDNLPIVSSTSSAHDPPPPRARGSVSKGSKLEGLWAVAVAPSGLMGVVALAWGGKLTGIIHKLSQSQLLSFLLFRSYPWVLVNDGHGDVGGCPALPGGGQGRARAVVLTHDCGFWARGDVPPRRVMGM